MLWAGLNPLKLMSMLAYLNQQCENKEQNALEKKVDNIGTNPRTRSGEYIIHIPHLISHLTGPVSWST